jgi:hypothetical protein
MKRSILFWLVIASVVLSGHAAPLKFSDALYPKFHHDRCLQCHQFNSKTSNGRSYGSHRNRYLCENCHKSRLTGLTPGEWMAPEGGRMDYTGKSARETCLMVLRNIGSGDKKALLRRHLLQDQRVLWAIQGGMTPAGARERVPGGVDEWRRDVNAWIDDGMFCE